MGSNRFYITLVINCLLIFCCAFLFFYFLQVRQQPSTAAGIALLALLLSFRLIYYVNRTNRILGHFLSYMHESDPSLHYSVRYVKKHFTGLNESMERLIAELKESRIEMEVQAQYLETILNNVSAGILCFDGSGQIQTMNRAAKNFLGVNLSDHLNELDRQHPGLGDKLFKMRAETECTETILHSGKSIQLAIRSSQIILKNNPVHIIVLNDISLQMEEQEILSWKKLIRVINHEIMNSMTPIITLSMAIRRKLSNGNKTKTAEELGTVALEDAIQSASIIEERSNGLVQFIERYKKLTSLPPLKPERFPSDDLFAKTEQLFKEEFEDRGIRFIRPATCNIEVEADRQMLEQVLINLIKNALEAFQDTSDPEIKLSCQLENNNQLCISVRDNGEGIPAEKQEQVFVPFFTTREEGSGIGLSLCRQIIRLHNGQILMDSSPLKGTNVIIRLPA